MPSLPSKYSRARGYSVPGRTSIIIIVSLCITVYKAAPLIMILAESTSMRDARSARASNLARPISLLRRLFERPARAFSTRERGGLTGHRARRIRMKSCWPPWGYDRGFQKFERGRRILCCGPMVCCCFFFPSEIYRF